MPNYIWINKDKKNKRVNQKDLDFYLKDGWELGRYYSSTKEFKWIHKGKKIKYVSKEDYIYYLNHGWNEGIGKGNSKLPEYTNRHSSIRGRIHIKNESLNKSKLIYKNELNSYLKKGWQLGRLNSSFKNLIWINDGNFNKRVKQSELDTYINNGWVLGRK